MTKSTLTSICLVVLLFCWVNGNAQSDNRPGQRINISIPEVALINLQGSKAITLSPSAPNEAGADLDFSTATDNSMWINYSSSVKTWRIRWITAEITSGSVPEGLSLSVLASSEAGKGNGRVGFARRRFIRLTNRPQVIIWGIRTCHTSIGENAGHNLTYKLDKVGNSNQEYANLVNGDTEIEITYTISD